MTLTPHSHLLPRLKRGRAVPLLCAFMAGCWVSFTFTSPYNRMTPVSKEHRPKFGVLRRRAQHVQCCCDQGVFSARFELNISMWCGLILVFKGSFYCLFNDAVSCPDSRMSSDSGSGLCEPKPPWPNLRYAGSDGGTPGTRGTRAEI